MILVNVIPDPTVLGNDLARLAHLMAMAVGLGTMVSTDIMTFLRVERSVSREFCRAIESAHRVMVPAILAAWVTGIVLIGLRTGFDPAAFTPKLFAKLIVVSMLTVTAVMIKWHVMPIIARSVGTTLMEVSLRDKLVLACCAALSMSGWSTALLLGASQTFRTADWTTLIGLLAVVYTVAIAVAIRAALVLHARVQNAIEQTSRIAVH
jgi:hypothetical protein